MFKTIFVFGTLITLHHALACIRENSNAAFKESLLDLRSTAGAKTPKSFDEHADEAVDISSK